MVPAFAADTADVTGIATDVVEEEPGFSIVRVFKIIWDAIKKGFTAFKNAFKNFIAFINGLFGSDEPEEPTTEEPTTEEPTTDEPTTEEPTTDEPTTEEPTTDEPTTEEPTTEEPTTEEPTIEVPTTEDPTTEEPTAEAKVLINIYDIDGKCVDVLEETVEVGETVSREYLVELVEQAGYIPEAGIYIEDGYNHSFDCTVEEGQIYVFRAEL